MLGAGIVAMILEMMHFLRNMSSPDEIALAMAVALQSPLYALMLSELYFAPVHQTFDARDETPGDKILPFSYVAVSVLIIFFLCAFFLASMLSFPFSFK